MRGKSNPAQLITLENILLDGFDVALDFREWARRMILIEVTVEIGRGEALSLVKLSIDLVNRNTSRPAVLDGIANIEDAGFGLFDAV